MLAKKKNRFYSFFFFFKKNSFVHAESCTTLLLRTNCDKCLRLCKSPALGELGRGEEGLHLGLQRRRLACGAGLALGLAIQLHHAVAGEGRVRSDLF